MPKGIDQGFLNWWSAAREAIVGSQDKCPKEGMNADTTAENMVAIFATENFDPGRKLTITNLNHAANDAIEAIIALPSIPMAYYCKQFGRVMGNKAFVDQVRKYFSFFHEAGLLANIDKLTKKFLAKLDSDKVCDGDIERTTFTYAQMKDCQYPLVALLSGDVSRLALLEDSKTVCVGKNQMILQITVDPPRGAASPTTPPVAIEAAKSPKSWSETQLSAVEKAVKECADAVLSTKASYFTWRYAKSYTDKTVKELFCNDAASPKGVVKQFMAKDPSSARGMPDQLAAFADCLMKKKELPKDIDQGLLNWWDAAARIIIGPPNSCPKCGMDSETTAENVAGIFSPENFDPGRKLQIINLNCAANDIVELVSGKVPPSYYYCRSNSNGMTMGSAAFFNMILHHLRSTGSVLELNFKKIVFELATKLDSEKICGGVVNEQTFRSKRMYECLYPLVALLSGEASRMTLLEDADTACVGKNKMILLINVDPPRGK